MLDVSELERGLGDRRTVDVYEDLVYQLQVKRPQSEELCHTRDNLRLTFLCRADDYRGGLSRGMKKLPIETFDQLKKRDNKTYRFVVADIAEAIRLFGVAVYQ